MTGMKLKYVSFLFYFSLFVCSEIKMWLQSNMPGALNVVFECLELLGISLPRDTDEQKKAFLQELSAMQKKLSAFSSAYDLINLPDCTDPIQLSIFKLYNFFCID